MKKCLLLLVMLLSLSLVACAKQRVTKYAPYFDGVFEPQASERTRLVAENLLELSHGMVSGVNERFQLDDPQMVYNATLDKEGNLQDGKNSVLELIFVDSNDAQFSDSFGTRIVLRLEIGKGNAIVNGSLTGKGNNPIGGLTGGDTAGRFRSGKAYIMYRDAEVAMGQIQAEFDGYKINANFRALAYSR